MKSKSLKKNYILNLIYQIITIIVPFITTPYISRVLQVEGVGAYSYTLAVATYMGTFAILGMDIYGQLQAAKCRDNQKECSKLIYGIFAAKFLTTAITILIYIVLEPYIGMYKNIYWIMIIFFLAQLVDFTWFFQGIEEFAFILTRNLLVKGIGVICIFCFVKKADDVGIYTIIMQGTVLFGNLIVIPYLRKFVLRIPFKHIFIQPYLKGGLVYFVPTIATSVYTMLDKAMIGWITKTPYENGYYEQAYKIVQMILVVVTSLRTVTLPRVVRLYDEKNYIEIRNIIDSTIRFVLCISLPMAIGLMMVAPQLVPLFLGDGFYKSILIVRILAVLIVVVGLSVLISGQCLTAMGKQKQANICVIVGAMVNFIMNLVLIPFCGALGAAIATVVAETLIVVMLFGFAREYVKIRETVKQFLKYGSCSAIMAGMIYALNYTGWSNEILLLSKVVLGVVVYFGSLLLMKDDLIINFAHSILHIRKKKSHS